MEEKDLHPNTVCLEAEHAKLKSMECLQAKYTVIVNELHEAVEDFMVSAAKKFKGDTIVFPDSGPEDSVIIDKYANFLHLKRLEVDYYNSPYPVLVVAEGDSERKKDIDDLPIFEQVGLSERILKLMHDHREMLKSGTDDGEN